MKKQIALVLVFFMFLFCLPWIVHSVKTSVNKLIEHWETLHPEKPDLPERPESSGLEFWIGDIEKEIDLSGLTVYGKNYSGDNVTYYGTDYSENAVDGAKSGNFVQYTISGYPFYESKYRIIKDIKITDPDVSIYGFSIGSTPTEVASILEEKGYSVKTDGSFVTAEQGDLLLIFRKDESITASVTVFEKEESESENFKYERLPEPENTLDFWVGENVDGYDFSNHKTVDRFMGGSAYYGLGYFPAYKEDGTGAEREYCVKYKVTYFPDYSSKHKHISEIRITDPEVFVYGISISSTYEQAQAALEAAGFTVTLSRDYYDKQKIIGLKASLGEYYVYFNKDSSYRIGFKVRNAKGIVF